LTHKNGIPPDKRIADKTEVIEHDPSDKDEAFKYARSAHHYFGLLYQQFDKPRYDDIIHTQLKEIKQKSRSKIFDSYEI